MISVERSCNSKDSTPSYYFAMSIIGTTGPEIGSEKSLRWTCLVDLTMANWCVAITARESVISHNEIPREPLE